VPGPLVTRGDLDTRSVSFQKRRFGTPSGKAIEARVFFSFTSADVPVSMPHGLGKKPSSFTVVVSGNAAGTGSPTIYTKDPSFWATNNVVVLSSDLANSWCEVTIRE